MRSAQLSLFRRKTFKELYKEKIKDLDLGSRVVVEELEKNSMIITINNFIDR